jgi:hypothetical protein
MEEGMLTLMIYEGDSSIWSEVDFDSAGNVFEEY